MSQDSICLEHKEIFDLAGEAKNLYRGFLKDFNGKKIKLIEIPPHKRIFLFFMTRVIKTFSAICDLCMEGYGQDAAPLLRSLLEILISVNYILYKPEEADEKAARFVEYKRVIFKRHLSELEREGRTESAEDILSRQQLVAEKFREYKQKYRITSDRTLLTWSGKSTRDMAKLAEHLLLEEYESAFRLDSRFSHPSIIGDKEYLDYKDNALVFSYLPSTTGVVLNLKRAVKYLTDFLSLFDSLFSLNGAERLRDFRSQGDQVFQMEKYRKALLQEKSLPSLNKDKAGNIRVQFNLPRED